MKSLLLILAGAACIYWAEQLSLDKTAANYAVFTGIFLVVTGFHWPFYFSQRRKPSQKPQLNRSLQDIRAHGNPKSFIALVKIISHAVSEGFSKHDMESCLFHMKQLKLGEKKTLEFNLRYQHHFVPMTITIERHKGDTFDYVVSTIPALVAIVTKTIQTSKDKVQK